jgi:AraC-like DNA-binding protein
MGSRQLDYYARPDQTAWLASTPRSNGFQCSRTSRCLSSPLSLEAGDYLIMIAPPDWVLRGGEPVTPVDFEAIDPGTHRSTGGRGEQETRIIGGHFEFDSANAHLLAALLSPVLHIRAGEADCGRLGHVLAMIDDEASSQRPGHASMLARLLEIVLIELLREPPTARDDEQYRGLLAGLGDPHVAVALRAMHAEIGRAWNVAALASLAAMSRSVFSQRFTQIVGKPPMTYLLDWRMAVARDLLRFSHRSLDEVAAKVGYGSASAFSTAFTRKFGQPPARFARTA